MIRVWGAFCSTPAWFLFVPVCVIVKLIHTTRVTTVTKSEFVAPPTVVTVI